MSHPMYCPVCDNDFEIELKCMSYSGGTIDSCGDANMDLQLHSTCPKCGFKVIAVFDYNHSFSNQMMGNENIDTHQIGYVKVEKYEEKWMTNEEVETDEEEDE